MIEDTSFIIDLLRGESRAIERLDYLEAGGEPEKISAMTVLELYEGLAVSDRLADEKSRVKEVLDSKHIIAADEELMRTAGRISGQLLVAGEQIDREDCLIGATALAENEPVLTRNEKHFERISDLEVRTY